MNFKPIFLLTGFLLLGACASNNSIFPSENLSLNESSLILANPTDIIVDAANDQLIVVNSNIDYYFDLGAIYTLDVDATDPNAPQLSATSARVVPNFATDALLNAGILYVPYREKATDTSDKMGAYTVGAGTIVDRTEAYVGKNPFGIAAVGAQIYVVNDESLSVLDADLNITDEVDLEAAQTAGIDDTDSLNAESVAADVANNRLYVSNRAGKVFVVDATTNAVTHVIDGPQNSRGLVSDGTRIYLIDGDAPSLWVLDPDLLPASTGSIQEVDDSVITIAQIDLGLNPNGIAYDAALGRVYVTNLGENSVSVIDTTILQEIARISFDKDDTGLTFDGEQPFAVAVGTFDGVPLVFVGNIDAGTTDSGTIFVINANTLKVVEAFPDNI